ncbi:MAG TPA: hypothetical protein VF033_10675, partial [Steroidobacteraceae bacterium]
MTARARVRLGALLWPFLATAALGAASAPGDTPWICRGGVWDPAAGKVPAEVRAYLEGVGDRIFDSRAACAQWAGFDRVRRSFSGSDPPPARLIVYPAEGSDMRRVSALLADSGIVRTIERHRTYLIASFAKRVTGTHLRTLLSSEQVEYAEPDCDGPDFLATSNERFSTGLMRDCWLRSARKAFPNDPCIDELWGHALIGWNPSVAARSLPRIVAVLDSGIDASHEDLKRNILQHAFVRTRTESGRLNARCATSGRC